MAAPRSTAIEDFRNKQQGRNYSNVNNDELTWKQIISTIVPIVLMAGGMLIVFAILFPILLVILFG
ncbi:MAG: hypothetical protein ABS939_00250 [Psychrobacillus sp.]